MKTMKWLLRREFWEHKGAMLLAPLVVGGLMLATILATLLYGLSLGQGRFRGQLTVNGNTTDAATLFAQAAQNQQGQISNAAADLYLIVSAPLFLMMAAVVFFYCLGALHDERRDRSILFWKSLPVSDLHTVLSKVMTAVIVAPLIVMSIAVGMSVLLVLLAAIGFAFHGVNIIGALLSNANFYLSPLRLVGLLPVYALWALPTVGWLLLVSAWARSKVFLWAVGVPVLTVVVLKWIDYLLGMGIDVKWFANNVVARALLGLVPGVWLPMAQADPSLMLNQTTHTVAMSGVFTASWMTLATPGVWIGAAAGAAMIYGAARLRRWKDEG